MATTAGAEHCVVERGAPDLNKPSVPQDGRARLPLEAR
jgi:hypothetical protein